MRGLSAYMAVRAHRSEILAILQANTQYGFRAGWLNVEPSQQDSRLAEALDSAEVAEALARVPSLVAQIKALYAKLAKASDDEAVCGPLWEGIDEAVRQLETALNIGL